MKKQLLPLLASLCLATACEKVDTASEGADASADNSNKKAVMFVMKGLSVDYTTRATVSSEGMTDLWIYEGETLLKHQVSTEDDFGTPTVTLDYGSHDLTFIASKSEGQAFGTYWTCTRPLDTYGTTMNVTVSKGSGTSRQVQLARVNSKVQWTIEDALPSNAATLTISVGNNYGLDASLAGMDAATYTKDVTLTGHSGQSGLSTALNCLPLTYGEENDVTATATVKKSDGTTICTYTNTVSVKANRITNIHGSFFGNDGSMTVSLTTDWDTQKDVDL